MPEKKSSVKPFVKEGQSLGFVGPLKERGLWPPRLHDPNHPKERQKTVTPYLVIPTTPADDGLRPQPNSKAFHSLGIWLEDSTTSAVVNAPVVGGRYRIKCRVRNMGAFPSYGGLADFFVNTVAAFDAAADTGATLPSIGHTGFSVKQGREVVLTCPGLLVPANSSDLVASIIVHAYDPFADNIIHRFDARNDRHVGRHDLAPDLYVRDWTDSATVHDSGKEPSARMVFYATSDVWNRRSATPGAFIDDIPHSQDVQAGDGAAGDNFIFARISRNNTSVGQTVSAHFLFAEFGTGSPFANCSSSPDPSVTLAPGESSKLISLPWHLHPSSSHHLCIAVQIYSTDDPYLPPGLLGYTPGWPTTDMMVISDNNKAQRNITVWDGIPEAGGMHFGIVFNAATFVRDVTLVIGTSEGARDRFKNARLTLPAAGITQEFRPGNQLVIPNMLPGERRWIAFSYDSFSVRDKEVLSVNFNEVVDKKVVNGFAFSLRGTTATGLLPQVLSLQTAVFYRMDQGLGVAAAKEGFILSQRLQETKANAHAYSEAVPVLARVMTQSLTEIWRKFPGTKDVLGVVEDLRSLGHANSDSAALLSLHNKALHKIDALQTMAVKSNGDLADTLFTVRLQKDVYKTEVSFPSARFAELKKKTDEFIVAYPSKPAVRDNYVSFVKSVLPFFKITADMMGGGVTRSRLAELNESLRRSPQEVQKAHLDFLNAVLLAVPNDRRPL